MLQTLFSFNEAVTATSALKSDVLRTTWYFNVMTPCLAEICVSKRSHAVGSSCRGHSDGVLVTSATTLVGYCRAQKPTRDLAGSLRDF